MLRREKGCFNVVVIVFAWKYCACGLTEGRLIVVCHEGEDTTLECHHLEQKPGSGLNPQA